MIEIDSWSLPTLQRHVAFLLVESTIPRIPAYLQQRMLSFLPVMCLTWGQPERAGAGVGPHGRSYRCPDMRLSPPPKSGQGLTNRIYTFNITTYPSLNKQGQGPETSPAMSRGHSLLFELTLRSSQSVSEFMQTELWITSRGPNIGTPSVATL